MTNLLTEPDFIYCLLHYDRPPMKDMLPVFHNIGDVFYFNSTKYQVINMEVATESDLEEIGWDFVVEPGNPPLLLYAEECGKINYTELTRDLKLRTLIENDDH